MLLVEDNDVTRRPLADLLRRQGYTVAEAGDGAEALTYLRQDSHGVALVLLDLNMPRMDGWEFRQHQRAAPELAAVPTVLFTTAILKERDLELLAVDDYVQKPVHFGTLVQLIARYCVTSRPPELLAIVARSFAEDRAVHTLVLLEGDTQARETHRIMLALAGYRVFGAARPADAVVAALRNRATAVLVDLDQVGVSSAEVLQLLLQARAMPAVAMATDPAVRAQALASGFASFLVKPVSPEALLLALDDVCDVG